MWGRRSHHFAIPAYCSACHHHSTFFSRSVFLHMTALAMRDLKGKRIATGFIRAETILSFVTFSQVRFHGIEIALFVESVVLSVHSSRMAMVSSTGILIKTTHASYNTKMPWSFISISQSLFAANLTISFIGEGYSFSSSLFASIRHCYLLPFSKPYS